MPVPISARFRRIARSLPWVIVAVAVLGTAGSPLGIWSSHIERMSHFRIAWVILLAGAALWFLRARRPLWAAVSGVVAVAASLVVVRYHLPPSGVPVAGPQLRVLAWNVLWENTRYAEAREWLGAQAADVMVLSECSTDWREALAEVAERYPHRFHNGRPGAEGMWLLSRHPFDPPEADGLAAAKPWISTVLHTPEGPLRLLGMHPRTPRSGARFDDRNAQYDHAARVAVTAGMPVVLAGDLNCTPYSPWFGRLLERGNLRDSGVGYGLRPTWRSMGVGLPIDHILTSDHFRVVDRQVHSERMGSDHHPVSAVLVRWK